MNDIQRQMLRRFGSFARNLRFFTSTRTSIADVVMASSVAQANLDSLVAQGLIYQKGDAYRITEFGRNLLDTRGKEQADYSRIPKESYTPPTWNVREGGEQFLGVPSRGMI